MSRTRSARRAGLLAQAKNPLIITTNVGRTPGGVAALARLAEQQAIPVVSYNPSGVELPSNHPMHMGQDVKTWLEQADVVIVAEAAVPWLPKETKPRAGATVIHIGEDPLYGSLPIRSFQCDLAITANVAVALTELADLLDAHPQNAAGAHRYDLAEYGLDRAAVEQTLAAYVARFEPGVE